MVGAVVLLQEKWRKLSTLYSSKNLLGVPLSLQLIFFLVIMAISRDIYCVLLFATNLVMNLCIYDHTTAEQI